MIKNIFFWGAKYKAGIINDLIENHKILADTKKLSVKFLFDPNLNKAKFYSKAKFSNKKKDLKNFIKGSDYFVTCIGSEYGKARYLISKELEKKKLKPLKIISKHSYISDINLIGEGAQVLPTAVIHHKAKIGDYCILNTGSIVEHDCTVGHGVHIMPGAVIGGNTHIGNYVTVGLNATVMPQLKIGEGAFIGAGAVVTKNVKKNEIVIGNPAQFFKLMKHKVDLSIFK
jgi:acetyltransferase EpsM